MALTQVDQGLLSSTAQYTGFKNRLINGQMQIDQRNNGASIVYTNQVYPVDRFYIAVYQTVLTGTLQQVSTAPAGFSKSTCITITTGQAVGSTDINAFRQVIEGNNLADFSYGTASAATSTLSFWVRSSVTGQFTVAIYNPTAGKWYSQPYTINAANTWEYKTVTVVGDTASTMATNNAAGLIIDWVLGAGSSYNGAASQTWSASTPRQITGSSNITTVNGATFFITGVQLEKGSTATSFDYRPYGTELALCQRYYEQYGPGYRVNLGVVAGAGGVTAYGSIRWIAPKRASPTVTVTGSFRTLGINQGNSTTPSFVEIITEGAFMSATAGFNYTAGVANLVQSDDSATGRINVSAEL